MSSGRSACITRVFLAGPPSASPAARSAIRNPSSGTIGLFQLHPTHKAWVKRTYGYDWNELTDPYKNAKVAKGLSEEAYRYYGDGFQPWRLSGRAIRGGGCPA